MLHESAKEEQVGMILEASMPNDFKGFAAVKEKLRKGEHLDEMQITHDWSPYAL